MDQTGRIQRIKVSPLHFTVGTSQNWSLLGWKCVSDIYLWEVWSQATTQSLLRRGVNCTLLTNLKKILVQIRWVSSWHTISDWHSYQPEISSLDEQGTLLEQMSTAICRALQLLKAKLNGVLPWVFALGEESIGNQHEISVARTYKKSLLDTTVFFFPRYNLFKYHQNSCSPACICI